MVMKTFAICLLAALATGNALRGMELVSLPMPNATNASFSRAPKAPFIGDLGSLVIEFVLPPVCKGGAAKFCWQRFSLSDDGTHLTVTQYNMQAPSDEMNLCRFTREYSTTTPLSFTIGKGTYIFTRNAEGAILTLDRITSSQDGTKTQRIFPADSSQIGIFP